MASRARREQPPVAAARARTPMGEPELETFYRGVFLPLVRRATWKYGLTKEDASDIVQDAFVLALGKLDSTGNPKAWLVQVVDHLSINHQRKVARRAHLTAKWGLCPGDQEEPGEKPELPQGVDH